MTLCRPPCFPRPTYPSDCPYALVPEVNICCLSSSATLSCDSSGSQSVAWSESREDECEARPLGTNLNGVMRSEWDTVAAEAAYTCLFGGVVPANYRVRLSTTWAYNCNTGFVMFECELILGQFDIWGNPQGQNRYVFARSQLAPDWYLSAPITVTCDDLDTALEQTVTCAETTVSLTCSTVAYCNVTSICWPCPCIADPQTGEPVVLIFADVSTPLWTDTVAMTYNPLGTVYQYLSGGIPEKTITLICFGGDPVTYMLVVNDGTNEYSIGRTGALTCDESGFELDSPTFTTTDCTVTLWTNNTGAAP